MSFACRGTKREMLIALVVVCSLSAAPGLWGQMASNTPPPRPPAGIEILARANPDTATIGDPILIDLDITMPRGYQAEIPKPAAQSDDFAIMDFFPGPSLPDAAEPRRPAQPVRPQAEAAGHHRARVVIAIYKTGKFTFPSIPVKIKTAGGEEIAASSPPVDIQIQSVLAGENPALKDLKKQAEILEPTRWLLWSILALSACLLCGILWHLRRRRSRKPLPLTPAQKQDLLELAETDLRNLLARGVPETGKEKQFYVILSDIAKRILSAGFGIHTAEQTTSEIMGTLDRNSVPGSEERKQIESFLLRCDVVKFAKYVPSGDEHAKTSEDALRILAMAKEALRNTQSAIS